MTEKYLNAIFLLKLQTPRLCTNVVDADPDPTFHFDTDTDPDSIPMMENQNNFFNFYSQQCKFTLLCLFRHRHRCYNNCILDSILKFSEKSIFWLYTVMGTENGSVSKGLRSDQDPPKLCRSDRIHNTTLSFEGVSTVYCNTVKCMIPLGKTK